MDRYTYIKIINTVFTLEMLKIYVDQQRIYHRFTNGTNMTTYNIM